VNFALPSRKDLDTYLEDQMPRVELEDLTVTQVNHLPIIKAFAKNIRLVEIINSVVPSRMKVSVGHVVLAMVIDTLSGRSPLYRLTEFYDGKDTELLLGKEIDPEYLRDYNLGRVLDSIFQAGTVMVFGEVARMAVLHFGIDTEVLHHDTTSVSVFGDYDLIDPPFLITYGHSKDKRPDLKQFLVSMLCAEGNIPIFGKTEDGNGSDKTINNTLLTNISRYLSKHQLRDDVFIYIADSAMVTEANLKHFLGLATNRYLSRLPATYSECSRVIRPTFSSLNEVFKANLNRDKSH
jgi:transposase